jgi:hypothetical protein
MATARSGQFERFSNIVNKANLQLVTSIAPREGRLCIWSMKLVKILQRNGRIKKKLRKAGRHKIPLVGQPSVAAGALS